MKNISVFKDSRFWLLSVTFFLVFIGIMFFLIPVLFNMVANILVMIFGLGLDISLMNMYLMGGIAIPVIIIGIVFWGLFTYTWKTINVGDNK